MRLVARNCTSEETSLPICGAKVCFFLLNSNKIHFFFQNCLYFCTVMAASNPYLQVEGLTCHVGDKTLFADLSMGVAQGQRIGLIAKNGTGKSSLLDIIAGHRQADGGTITWRRDLRVAYLEQTPHFPEGMTVMEACLWMCDEEPLRIKEYLTKLDIRHHDQLVSQLSGGQLKRVALANVLCRQPDFLILPTILISP